MAICGPFSSTEWTVLTLLALFLYRQQLSYIILLYILSSVEWYKMNRFNQMENMREGERMNSFSSYQLPMRN